MNTKNANSAIFTYISLVDPDEVLNRTWNRHYKPKEANRTPVAKDEAKIPQSARDVMRIMYDLVNPELRKGETRHLLGLQSSAKEIGATKTRVRAAIERALSDNVLALAKDQPSFGKRYIVPDDLIEVRTIQIDDLNDLQEHVRKTTGSTDLYWKAYFRVRENHARATVARVVAEIEKLTE